MVIGDNETYTRIDKWDEQTGQWFTLNDDVRTDPYKWIADFRESDYFNSLKEGKYRIVKTIETGVLA